MSNIGVNNSAIPSSNEPWFLVQYQEKAEAILVHDEEKIEKEPLNSWFSTKVMIGFIAQICACHIALRKEFDEAYRKFEDQVSCGALEERIKDTLGELELSDYINFDISEYRYDIEDMISSAFQHFEPADYDLLDKNEIDHKVEEEITSALEDMDFEDIVEGTAVFKRLQADLTESFRRACEGTQDQHSALKRTNSPNNYIVDRVQGETQIHHAQIYSLIVQIEGRHYRIYPYRDKVVEVHKVITTTWKEEDEDTTDITP